MITPQIIVRPDQVTMHARGSGGIAAGQSLELISFSSASSGVIAHLDGAVPGQGVFQHDVGVLAFSLRRFCGLWIADIFIRYQPSIAVGQSILRYQGRTFNFLSDIAGPAGTNDTWHTIREWNVLGNEVFRQTVRLIEAESRFFWIQGADNGASDMEMSIIARAS